MNKTEVYIGIDVHKESNLVGYAFVGREKAAVIGKVSADLNRTVAALRKFQKDRDLEKEQLHICYEAGPTGFVLARRLNVQNQWRGNRAHDFDSIINFAAIDLYI